MSWEALEWAWENGESQTERIVLLRLAKHADPRRRCFPAAASIAKYCKLNIRSVRRALSNLAGAGLITAHPQFKDGRRIENSFHLHLERGNQPPPKKEKTGISESHDAGDSMARRPCHRVTAGVTQSHTESTNESPKKEKNASGAMMADESAVIDGHTLAHWFVSFWNGYPRREGKRAARVAFMKAAAVASMDEIRAGLRRYKANLPADRRFILSPARWLLEERWTDEPPTATRGAARIAAAEREPPRRADGLTPEQVREYGL